MFDEMSGVLVLCSLGAYLGMCNKKSIHLSEVRDLPI